MEQDHHEGARALSLMRHGLVAPLPGVAPAKWPLAPGAEAGLARLARELRGQVDRVVSSPEPKAMASAQIVAAELGLELSSAQGLEEHWRGPDDFCPDPAQFRARIRAMMAEPGAVLFGRESAEAALARFSGAVARVMQQGGAPCVVTHGTVLALYLQARGLGDAYTLWSGLQMPDHFRLDWRA